MALFQITRQQFLHSLASFIAGVATSAILAKIGVLRYLINLLQICEINIFNNSQCFVVGIIEFYFVILLIILSVKALTRSLKLIKCNSLLFCIGAMIPEFYIGSVISV